MSNITVLIPCFNEAEAIASVIKKFPYEQIRRAGHEIEILVVDNNSADNTAAVAAEAGARVICETKQGKGNAIRTGFYNISSNTDFVVMLDGDDTYRSEELMRLIEPLESGFTNVVIGSRMHGRIKAGSMKRLNRFGNRMYSGLVRVSYKVMVSDVLTGYFGWSREVVEELRGQIKSQGFAIEMEMVTKMARMGHEIYSVPISYEPRLGDSSLNPIRDGARILVMFTKNLRWKPKSLAGSLDNARGYAKHENSTSI